MLYQFPEFENIIYDSQTLQALNLIAGSTVRKFIYGLQIFRMPELPEVNYAYLEILDIVPLKWPSERIVDIVAALWRIFVAIDGDYSLMSVFTKEHLNRF